MGLKIYIISIYAVRNDYFLSELNFSFITRNYFGIWKSVKTSFFSVGWRDLKYSKKNSCLNMSKKFLFR